MLGMKAWWIVMSPMWHIEIMDNLQVVYDLLDTFPLQENFRFCKDKF